MPDAYVIIKNNTAEITLPAGVTVNVKAKTNSSSAQTVTVTSTDGSVNLQFSGAGERNASAGQSTITGQSQVTATFQYSDSNGVSQPSRLNSGGPYQIGSYNLMVIVAENGDDSDYNDAILEFSWYTPKW